MQARTSDQPPASPLNGTLDGRAETPTFDSICMGHGVRFRLRSRINYLLSCTQSTACAMI